MMTFGFPLLSVILECMYQKHLVFSMVQATRNTRMDKRMSCAHRGYILEQEKTDKK